MRKVALVVFGVIIVLIVLAIFQGVSISRLSEEVERQKSNVQTLVDKELAYKICDSINVCLEK